MIFTGIFLTLVSFLTEPYFIIEKSVEMTTLPEGTVEINGILDKKVPVSIKYNSSENKIEITEGENTELFEDEEIPLWLKLFFRDYSLTPDKQTGLLQVDIQSSGIDMSEKTISRTGPRGPLTYIIGKSNVEDNKPFIEYYKQNSLPYRIKTGEKLYIFSDYHHSRYPLSFPGKITVINKGEVIGEYNFIHDKYRKVSP